MTWSRRTVVLAFVLVVARLLAAEPVEGATQKEIAEKLGSLALAHSVELDDDGNVIRFGASNHAGIHHRDGSRPAKPGIDDEAFAAVLKFPKLRAIFLEKQPLTDAGYALLKQLPELKDVRLHHINDKQFADTLKGATSDAILIANDMPNLKTLEIKHCFGLQEDNSDELKPQAELEKLEIDVPWSKEKVVPFVLGCPKVKNLQLHRTSITNEQLAAIGKTLGELELIELRPAWPANLTAAGLAGLREHPKLRAVLLSLDWGPLPWENGLQHLAIIPNLEYVEINVKGITPDSEGIEQLRQMRPDITVRLGRDVLTGTKGYEPIEREQDYRWGIAT